MHDESCCMITLGADSLLVKLRMASAFMHKKSRKRQSFLPGKDVFSLLMMEESRSDEAHYHVVLVCSFDYVVVSY